MGQGKSTVRHLNRHHSHYSDTTEARNLLFEDGFGLKQLHHHRSHSHQLTVHSSEMIEAVICNNYENLLLKVDSLLSGGASTHDINLIKEDVAMFKDDTSDWNVFHYAAHHNSDSILEKLIEFLRDSQCVNGRSKAEGLTALHLAVQGETDNDRLVSVLLQHRHIDVDARDADEWTPLHHACYRGFYRTVVALQNANFCYRNHEGDSPLHLAASNQHSAIFSALFECKAFKEKYCGNSDFIEVKDKDGNTLLHLAVDIADSDLINWCLEFGFKVQTCNNVRMNCLHIAARRGDYDIAVHILRQGSAEGVDNIVNSQNSDHSTPLYMAAMFGNVKIIKLLLHKGARTDYKNSIHLTPLLAAIRYTQPEAVRILLRRGADVMAKDRLRNYNAILWAVEIKNTEILNMLLDHVLEKQEKLGNIWKETDSDGNTAHHVAAKAKNLDVLKILMQHDTSCLRQKNADGFTPFHISVCEGKLGVMNYIMSNDPNAAYVPDGHGSSGLHLAAEYGHANIVDRLLRVRSSNSYNIGSRDNRGWTPIHLAAKNGHLAALEQLLQHCQQETLEILDNHHQTALYLACTEGRPKCVDLLIKKRAMVTYNYHSEENKSMSCLNAAIDTEHFTVVATILESDQWCQALQYCSNDEPNAIETPLRKLITKMPGAAKYAFERCVTTVKPDNSTETIDQYEVHYNYDFIEDFQDLFRDHGPKIHVDDDETYETSQGRFAHQERRVLRRSMSTVHSVTSLASSQTEDRFLHHEPTAEPRQQGPWGPKKYSYQNHPLHLMVIHKRQELLKHPLIASFIHHKWNLFGRWVYYPNIAFYTLLMLLLTAYIYLRFDYSKVLINTYEEQLNTSLSLSDCSLNVTLDSLSGMDDDVVKRLHHDRDRLIICSAFIIFQCIVRILMEIYQIIHHLRDYFLHYINYLESILYVATILFVSNFQLHCLPSWQWQLGALCIFLSWINFILFLSEQPVVGIYVVMFQDIIKTFLHMAPMAILLVLAFGQPFFMLLSVVDNVASPQQFITFPYSLLKTLAMTTGELETDRIFFGTPSVVVYPVVTYILWITFLVIMPILLQNMLVGLAVDDIKSVQEKAALKKEALQIEFILDILSRTPKCLVQRINQRKYIQMWGKNPVDKFWKWLKGSYWKPDLKLDHTKEYSVALKMDNMLELVSTVDKRIQAQLTEQNAKLEKLMLHFSHEHDQHVPLHGKDRLYSSSESVI